MTDVSYYVARVLNAALEHVPTTAGALAWECCEGECGHDGECPEIDIEVCAACMALVGYDGETYPAEVLATGCPVCVAVVAWIAAS